MCSGKGECDLLYNFYNAAPLEATEVLVRFMKLFCNLILSLVCYVALGTGPRLSAEPEPTPTPHEEPSATPHEEPSATPDGEPGDEHDGEDGDNGDDQGGDDGEGDHDGGEHGDFSLHGFYKGTTPTGALAIFYIESNTHVQINVLDVASQQIGFAEGALTDGSFSLLLTNGQAVSGVATEDAINVSLDGVSFRAEHAAFFGERSTIAGRYAGLATGPTGSSTVMFVIDAQGNIVMVQIAESGRTGGYGTISALPGSSGYSFTLENVIGSSSPITGSFTIVDGVFSGSFTTSAGTYTVASFKQALAHRVANISTRGLVGPGQGQLIGGFIISGGPTTVVVRALGPSLTAAGVSPVVANPSLQLFAGGTLLASNDDWATSVNAAQIAASTLAPTNPLESALILRLEPGGYTTVVSNGDGSTAIALVEVYELGSE